MIPYMMRNTDAMQNLVEALLAQLDAGFDYHIHRTACHDQVLDVVAAQKQQPSAPVYVGLVDHLEPRRLARIAEAVRLGQQLGLQVNAGHGLDYHNVRPIAALAGVRELNGFKGICIWYRTVAGLMAP